MNRTAVVQTGPHTWEARVGRLTQVGTVPAFYVVRIRSTRRRARLAALRMYLTGVGVVIAA